MEANTTVANSHVGIRIPARALADDRLTRTDLKVLGAFCGCADWQTGWGYPKAQNLAAQLGMTKRTFSKYNTRLKAAGYLFRGRRHEHGGFWWWVDYSGRSRPPEGDSKSPPRGRLLYATSSGPRTTPAPPGPEEEEPMPIQDRSVYEDGGSAPTRPAPRPKKDTPPKLNAMTLAHRFRSKALLMQPGCPDPVNVKVLAGAFARWHRQKVNYKVLRLAQDLFWIEYDTNLEAPAGRVFMKWAAKWIALADEENERREMPARVERYRARRAAQFAEMEKTDPGLRNYRASRFPPGPARDRAAARGF